MRQGLIVGIDPGVTTAVVMLDLNGNIMDAKSRKFFSFNDIISCVSAQGDPVIVSSDVNPPPRLVQRVASAFGARLHYPSELITAVKKAGISKCLTHKFNDHEKDAYVAATIAFEKFRKDFEKIDSMLKDDEKGYADKAKNLLVKGAPSIKEAIDSAVIKTAGEGADYEQFKKILGGRAKEISMLRKMLNFYRKGKPIIIDKRENSPTPREIKLENELRSSKQRAEKVEEAVKSAKRVFRRFIEGWIPALVAADFKKESLKAVESCGLRDRWLIILNNTGISRDALSFLETKGVQGVVCGNSRLLSEFKTVSHMDISEADFECAEWAGALNPSSMKSGIESVREDFIKWAKSVSDG
ncbi:MAG: DUF460 domain-containing protein [Candidatus Aenigmarchaeota archaeon]|nr:DUF460 domain-containing protein [Candidatus Aenigmarchaeota archaeon]